MAFQRLNMEELSSFIFNHPKLNLILNAWNPYILRRMDKKYLMIYCTVPDEKNAIAISKTLVSENLAACCNIIPSLRSIYTWQGTIHDDTELLLLIKSREDVYNRLEQRIKELHPYEVPEILAVEIKRGSIDYLKWVNENVG